MNSQFVKKDVPVIRMDQLEQGQLAEVVCYKNKAAHGCVVLCCAHQLSVVVYSSGEMPIGDRWTGPCSLSVRLLERDEKIIMENE